jgi:signal transduction histidine kinase
MKLPHVRPGWLFAAAAVLLFAVLGLLFAKAHAFDEAGFLAEIGTLRRIRQLDAQLQIDVLKSRSGMTAHYDLLGQSTAELRRLMDELEAPDPATTASGYAKAQPLAQARRALAAAIREETAQVEQFKSAMAILRNSLQYLPLAANEVHATLTPLPPVAAHRAEETVNRLLVHSLRNALGGIGPPAPVRPDAEQLAAIAANLSPAARESTAIFIAHVRAIAREQRKVNAFMDGIDAVPMEPRLDEFANLLNAQAQQARAQTRLIGSFLVLFSSLLGSLLLYAAWQLRSKHVQLARVHRQVKEAKDLLEQRVRERTRELRETQDQLISTARRAGMAEIANNVLHNVGNILNSVNVSTDVIGSKIRNSRTRGLARAVQMMAEREHDLADFLTSDEKGRLLPRYLRELSAALQQEQQSMASEVEDLRRSVEHIKAVVATQQSYAGQSSSLLVRARVQDLVEDALRINAHACAEAGITIVRGYQEVPETSLDRDRVLQILVNLIANARHAMAADGELPHVVTLELAASDGTLRVAVSDNGQGIAPENLTRIFQHGFTTRASGHGFGLHSCALAARQMGGTLTAHSAGPGRGACFTLELPLDPVAPPTRTELHLPGAVPAAAAP